MTTEQETNWETVGWEEATLTKDVADAINERLKKPDFREGDVRQCRKREDGTLFIIVAGKPIVVKAP